MITVVIPAFNEESAIGPTVARVSNVLTAASIVHEVLVIDDGSMDATAERARASGARVIRHPHNVGYGQALKTGIGAASHDTIVIIDADLTYPPDAILNLLERYAQGFDMVVGARTGHYYHGSVFKGPLRSLLKFVVEFTAGRAVPDANSGLRVFSRKTATGYLRHLCDTFSFTTSMTLAYMLTGRFVDFIPIDYHARIGSTKVRLVRDALRTIQYIAQSIVYYNPIKFFVLVAAACVGLALGSFLVGWVTGLHAPYYLGIGGFLIAMLVFCLGLLADLLRQIMVKE